MIKYDNVTKENTKKRNPNWPQVLHFRYKIFITGGSGSRKTNTLLNLINQHNDDEYLIVDKIYLYVKDPNKTQYWYVIYNISIIF